MIIVVSEASDLYEMPFISYLSDLIHITVQFSRVRRRWWGGGGEIFLGQQLLPDYKADVHEIWNAGTL